jgi:hypothetical protein
VTGRIRGRSRRSWRRHSASCAGRTGRGGPKRLVFEMDRRGYGTVTRSTVYRALVRNGLIEPRSRRRRREDYRRWERPVAMQLWQMDVTACAFLADGREVTPAAACTEPASPGPARSGRGHHHRPPRRIQPGQPRGCRDQDLARPRPPQQDRHRHHRGQPVPHPPRRSAAGHPSRTVITRRRSGKHQPTNHKKGAKKATRVGRRADLGCAADVDRCSKISGIATASR